MNSGQVYFFVQGDIDSSKQRIHDDGNFEVMLMFHASMIPLPSLISSEGSMVGSYFKFFNLLSKRSLYIRSFIWKERERLQTNPLTCSANSLFFRNLQMLPTKTIFQQTLEGQHTPLDHWAVWLLREWPSPLYSYCIGNSISKSCTFPRSSLSSGASSYIFAL